MNKKFGVKITYVAKDNNPEHKGQILSSIHGKGGAYEHESMDNSVEDIVKRIGWNRLQDANRFINFDKENCKEYYWDTKYEIISIGV